MCRGALAVEAAAATRAICLAWVSAAVIKWRCLPEKSRVGDDDSRAAAAPFERESYEAAWYLHLENAAILLAQEWQVASDASIRPTARHFSAGKVAEVTDEREGGRAFGYG